MNTEIPLINAKVTDRNRKQTKRICELRGWAYIRPCECGWPCVGHGSSTTNFTNGSFTLCQVVGMLEAEGAYWSGGEDCSIGNWEHTKHGNLAELVHAHDLTAAMDALIELEGNK